MDEDGDDDDDDDDDDKKLGRGSVEGCGEVSSEISRKC